MTFLQADESHRMYMMFLQAGVAPEMNLRECVFIYMLLPNKENELFTAQDRRVFVFRSFVMKLCDIFKYGMNLKLEIIVQIFRKIIKLNVK